MGKFLTGDKPHYRKPGQKFFDEPKKIKITEEDIERMMKLIGRNNELEKELEKQARNAP